MRKKLERFGVSYALLALVLTSVLLHVINIQYPATPVFDELHFTTYATDYLEHRPLFDIHPPLGKIFYAAVIGMASHDPMLNGRFVSLQMNQDIHEFEVSQEKIDYAGFPYISLRIFAALFGVLLPLAFYGFLISLGFGEVAAFFGALLITFENSFLLETRLILLNGMFLVFGLTALAFYFHRERWAKAGGVLMGVALGVKLIGILFFAPIIVAYVLKDRAQKKSEWKYVIRFFGTAFAVLLLLTLTNNIFFSLQGRFDLWNSYHFFGDAKVVTSTLTHPTLSTYIGAWILESDFTFGGYTGIGSVSAKHHIYESPWYKWPVMLGEMTYYEAFPGAPGRLVLVGNPAVWLASTFAVFVSIFFAFRFFKKRNAARRAGDEDGRKKFDELFILLGSYFLSFVPYIFIIHRNTFLYHYFPSLIFAIGILVWYIEQELRLTHFADLTRRQVSVLTLLTLTVIAGFVLMAPYTYGLTPFF